MRYLDLIHPEYKKEVERFYGIQYVKKIPATYYELPIITKQREDRLDRTAYSASY